MKIAIDDGTPMDLVDNIKSDVDEADKEPHGNSISNDVIKKLIKFVEVKCETYPLKRRRKTHNVRGDNTTTFHFSKNS